MINKFRKGNKNTLRKLNQITDRANIYDTKKTKQKTRPARRGGGTGGTTLHNAFVNGSASGTATQACFLDTDTTGDSIDVYCTICGGTALSSALPLLSDGKRITVWYDGTYWRCTTIFANDDKLTAGDLNICS